MYGEGLLMLNDEAKSGLRHCTTGADFLRLSDDSQHVFYRLAVHHQTESLSVTVLP